VFVLKSGFFDTLTWEAIAHQSLHLPLQTKPFPPSQSKVLRTKERDNIRPRISKQYWSGTGTSKFILPFLWTSDEKGPAWNHRK